MGDFKSKTRDLLRVHIKCEDIIGSLASQYKEFFECFRDVAKELKKYGPEYSEEKVGEMQKIVNRFVEKARKIFDDVIPKKIILGDRCDSLKKELAYVQNGAYDRYKKAAEMCTNIIQECLDIFNSADDMLREAQDVFLDSDKSFSSVDKKEYILKNIYGGKIDELENKWERIGPELERIYDLVIKDFPNLGVFLSKDGGTKDDDRFKRLMSYYASAFHNHDRYGALAYYTPDGYEFASLYKYATKRQ